MSILLVLAYVLPIIGLLAVGALILSIVFLASYTAYERYSERRVAAGGIARARV